MNSFIEMITNSKGEGHDGCVGNTTAKKAVTKQREQQKQLLGNSAEPYMELSGHTDAFL